MIQGERFTCLCLSVVLRGCMIPVAWHLMRAGQPGEWKPHWLRLLTLLAGAIPPEWHVVVMADRGLYAGWLFQAIREQGWHPFLRVNESMGFRAEGEDGFRPIGERVQRRTRRWSGAGEWSEQGERESGTLLVRWEQGYEEKLAVVTDLRGNEAEAAFYQMRFWMEDGFKDQKRGGWRWEQTKMRDPERASRLWFALAVAMLWTMRVGSAEEAFEQAQQKRRQTQKPTGKRGRSSKQFHRPRAREQSCVMRGQQTISVAVALGEDLPLGQMVEEAWPRHLYAVGKPASSWVQKRKRKEQRRREHHRTRSWKQRQQQKLEREREREAKRQARLQQRVERQQEQEAKRRARLERQQEQETKRQWQTQQREASQVRQRELPSAVLPSSRFPRPVSPPPLVRCSHGHLVVGSPSASLADRPQAKRAPQAPRSSRRPSAPRPLVGLYQGRLVPIRPPEVQENPP